MSSEIIKSMKAKKQSSRDTPYLSVFSPNAGKYGPEKLRIGLQLYQKIGSGKVFFL